MHSLRKIAAAFFLSLFGLYLLHNIFPHTHHDHELSQASELQAAAHHHHDATHHHHSDKNDSDQDQSDFFDFLFNSHSHFKHPLQHSIAVVETLKAVKQVVIKDFYSNDPYLFTAKDTDVGWHRYVLFDDVDPDNPYLQTTSLRGPPVLG